MAMDGERGTRGEPGNPWRSDLGTLLNAEMERHQPDSDRIRARIAASLGAAFPPGPAPTAAPLALVDGPTSPFTPYGELEHDPPVETTAPVAGTGSGTSTGSGVEAAPGTSAAPGSGGRPIRGTHGSRIRAGRGGPRRQGRRHGRILVGAAVAGVSMVLVALLAVVSGIPGTGSPNPPVTTVTGAPHPIGSPWATTATTEPTSATTPLAQDGRTPPPASAPPPAQTAPRTGQNAPAGSAASGSSDLPAADTTPVTQGRYTSQTVPFPAGSQVRLPTDATDWVLFGDGWNGVRTRAALPVPRLLAFASGSATQKSTSGFTWFGGFPNLIGSDDNERLAVQGRATLSTVVLQPRQLQIYLGASTGAAQITITSLAGTHTFTVDLPSRQVDGSSDAMITLTLPGAIGTTTITITGVDGAAWTLAAAVLR